MKSIKSFVRRQGQITVAQRQALDLYAHYIIDSTVKTHINFENYFDKKDVILEIGFGMGLATYQIALNNPDKGYLGIEVYPAGVGKLLLAINKHSLENLYIIQDDAVEVVSAMISDSSLSGIHIFYPDPWPKKRHHKRRLLQKNFVQLLISKLKIGGYIYIVTDWEEYAREIFSILDDPSLFNPYSGYAEPQDWRPITRFNEKANIAGRYSWEMYATRI